MTRTREDIRARAGSLGMVTDMPPGPGPSHAGSALSRVAADAMRSLGIREDVVRAKYGVSPEPLARRDADRGEA